MKTIGVLALQGDFLEHIHILEKLNVDAVEVRISQQILNLDGLIIPGGESTTIGKLARRYGLIKPIQDMIKKGKPVWGTCAGMILFADKVVGCVEDYDQDQPATKPLFRTVLNNAVGMRWIGGIDIHVVRNAFGRQVDSFEIDLKVKGIKNEKKPFLAVFIRAPLISKTGKNVEVLARLDDGTIVAAQQGNLLVTSFHPELTDDTRLHEYFVRKFFN